MFTIPLLAENIRKFRTANNMTQTQLAQRINVSCQAISKWERGAAVPELDKLCLLSREFCVSLDELVGNMEDGKKIMLGVDGGGSKTEFVLFDEDGNILRTLRLGPCNPNTVGLDNAVKLLQEGIEQLRQTAPDISAAFVGGAGFKVGGNGEKIAGLLSRKYPQMKIRCDSDAVNVFASAHSGGDSIAGICGTGTCVYLLKNGVYTRYTGWGYLLDVKGSGFHIGRDAIRAALEEAEGLGDETLLSGIIRMRLEAPVRECIRDFYSKGPAYIASFAQCVFEAYALNDKKAREILEDNARRFAFVINKVAQDHPGINQIILSGSIVTKNDCFLQMVKNNLNPGLNVVLPELTLAQGACIVCARMCDVDAEKIYRAFKAQNREG